MNAGNSELKVKRVSSRKRSRDSLKTHLTPARKKGGGPCSQQCPTDSRIGCIMADKEAVEFCSDSEDLFGDYDSILEDSSLLAKLDQHEQTEKQIDVQPPAHKDSVAQPGFTSLRSSEGVLQKQSCEDMLTDSILEGFAEEPFDDLPASLLQFQEQVNEASKRSRLQDGDGDKTSTPSKPSDRIMEDTSKRKARRSVADQLKRTMLCNAAAPSSVSRTVVLKEAVVSEEISVAMQAMETVSAETTDLGPFFGLPSRVKDLMDKLRGIKSLYGEETFSLFFFSPRAENLSMQL